MKLPNRAKVSAALLYAPTGVLPDPRRLIGRGRGLRDAVTGKTVLVTGASQGIGEAAARKLAGAGATVLLVARNRERLEEVAAEIRHGGGEAHVYAADLSDREDVERLAAVVLERHEEVDVLVNNAGRSIRRSVDLSYDRFHDFERTMALNYFGAVGLVLALLPAMRERGEGHIVNVSTAGVNTRVPRFSAYTASKAALEAFSDCVAAEAAHDGVRFTSVHMPLVRTPMIEPTGVYREVPSISSEQAADRIALAIVRRPRKIGTAFSDAAGILNVVAPGAIELMRSIGYRTVPDSRAARRGAEGDEGRELQDATQEDKEQR